jgi:hypothetical protein
VASPGAEAAFAPTSVPGAIVEAIIARRAFRCLMPQALQSDCTMRTAAN